MENAELKFCQKEQFPNGQYKSYTEKGQEFTIVREAFITLADRNQADQVDAAQRRHQVCCTQQRDGIKPRCALRGDREEAENEGWKKFQYISSGCEAAPLVKFTPEQAIEEG
jgi:hypothetical protein